MSVAKGLSNRRTNIVLTLKKYKIKRRGSTPTPFHYMPLEASRGVATISSYRVAAELLKFSKIIGSWKENKVIPN